LSYFSNYVWIALGAIVGASTRYLLSVLISRNFVSAFPYGTLLINITGSLVLGFFLVFSTERALLDPRWRLLLPSVSAVRTQLFPATPSKASR